MQVPVTHTEHGDGVLTTEHHMSSYGQPVFVRESDGGVFGTGDIGFGYIHRQGRPREIPGYNNTVPVYRDNAAWDPVEYTPEQEAFMAELVIDDLAHDPAQDWDAATGYHYRTWRFGASWKNAEIVRRAEERARATGRRIFWS